MSSGYPEFRRKLDAVLRQRDPQALRAFLVGEGQWDANTATDPEQAMWMMIATSPALAALRDEAIAWLAAHGYAEEARTLGRGAASPPPPRTRGGYGGGASGGHGGNGPGPHGGHSHGGRPNSGHGKPGGPNTSPRRPGDRPAR